MGHRRFIARTPRRFSEPAAWAEGATLPYTCHVAALKTAVRGASGPSDPKAGWGFPAGLQTVLPRSLARGVTCAVPTRRVTSYADPCFAAGHRCIADPASGHALAYLDYEFFKTRVQPIFLAKRPGHARCISCHGSGTPLRLQPLAPGATTWTEEESQKNFEAFKRVVVPGNPLGSRLLTHPLAQEAGGDLFHNGGKHWNSQSDPEWQTLATWARGQAAASSTASASGKVRIIQTNSAGDNVHIIDAATNKVVGEITGIEVSHGAAAAPDGSRIYVSNEADSTLDVVDTKTLKVTKKIKLTGHPNNIAIGRDGRRVYVAHRSGAWRGRCHRYSVADECEDDSNQRKRAQYICDARRQIRRRGFYCREEHDRHRHLDRGSRVGVGF